jgi:hypothetical protein
VLRHLILTCLLALPVAARAADVPAADRRWADGGPGGTPGFLRHVQPLLGKLGCSNRACHGSFQGKGGFRLSLFASDPQLDHDGLVKQGRVDLRDPDESLALLKATNQYAHKGGERFKPNGWEHRLLRAWIAQGAKYQPGKEAAVLRLEVQPAELILAVKGRPADLRVTAQFSDGSREDVTALTQFSSNDDGVAAVNAAGKVAAARPGDTAVVVTFAGAVRTVPVLVPLAGTTATALDFPPNNRIDELVAAKLRKLGIVPAGLCSDAEFLRRVSLDSTGTLPTPEEVLAFLADQSPDKRDRKIDELLRRPAHAVWWKNPCKPWGW